MLNSLIGLHPSEMTGSQLYLTRSLTTFFEHLPNYDRTYLMLHFSTIMGHLTPKTIAMPVFKTVSNDLLQTGIPLQLKSKWRHTHGRMEERQTPACHHASGPIAAGQLKNVSLFRLAPALDRFKISSLFRII
jgi:hypothetical protein